MTTTRTVHDDNAHGHGCGHGAVAHGDDIHDGDLRAAHHRRSHGDEHGG